MTRRKSDDRKYTVPVEIVPIDDNEDTTEAKLTINPAEFKDIDLDDTPAPENRVEEANRVISSKRVLEERRGRMPLSNTGKNIDATLATQQMKQIHKDFEDAKADALAYINYIIKCAKKLENPEGERFTNTSEQFARQTEISFQLDIVDKCKDNVSILYLNSDGMNSKETMNTLIDNLQPVHNANIAFARLYGVKERTEFVATSKTLLDKFVTKFTNFLNKVKSFFGFTDAEKKALVDKMQVWKVKIEVKHRK